MERAKFIGVKAQVRYWEDASINGKEDSEGHIPCRRGNTWAPVIELETGRILDWQKGIEARIHYKVCDEGEYWLLDSDLQPIAKWRDYYVPDDILCVGDTGYGDYIIMRVAADGSIEGWKRPFIDAEEWELD